jgi:hypothetical protein
MGKIFWVILGFFVLTLVMLAARKVVAMIKQYLPEDPLHDSEIDKNIRKLCSLKLEMWEGFWDMAATVSGYLGILTCMVGLLVIAWHL